MAYPTNVRKPAPPKIQHTVINRFLGMDISMDPTYIDEHRSPDLWNMMPINSVDFEKRFGFTELFEEIDALYHVKGMFYNPVCDDDLIYFILSDRKIYSYTISTGTVSSALTVEGVPAWAAFYGDRVNGFNYGDKIYIVSDNHYFVINSAGTISSVSSYVPTITVSTPMAGGGTPYEDPNILTTSVTQLFSGDGTTGTANLLYSDIDSGATIYIDGELVFSTEYSVNTTTGVVDFTGGEAPWGIPDAGTNNIEITYSNGLPATEAHKIHKTTIADVYGGANDLRVWVSGNPDYPNRDWRSGVQDPTYFPTTGYDDLGNPHTAIVGYALLYEYQIIIKEDSIHRRYYTFDDDGNAIFPTNWLSRDRGASHKNSIQMLDSLPVFLSSDGVYRIVSVDPNNENNIQNISIPVNYDHSFGDVKGLIETFDGQLVSSLDYKNQYWLIGDNGEYWVYDYRYKSEQGLGEWYRGELYSGISYAKNIGGSLYVAHSERSSLGIQKTQGSTDPFSDSYYNTATPAVLTAYAIEAYWCSKQFDFGNFTNIAFVYKLFIKFKKGDSGSAEIYWRSDVNSVYEDVWYLLSSIDPGVLTGFEYSKILYSEWTYGGNTFPKNFVHKLKRHHTGHGQVKIYNNTASERLAFLSVVFQHMLEREVK